MATWVAECITQKLLESSVIEEGDRELYCYGFFLLITHTLFFLVTIVAGLLAGIPCESVLFYIIFILLRTYAGGVHAKTETACTILTTLALTVSVFGIKVLKQMSSCEIPLLMLTSGSLCILLFSPLDAKDKPLDEWEKKKYRTVSVSVVLFCITVGLGTYWLSLNAMLCSLACGVCLEGVLLIIGKICCVRNRDTN